MRAGKQERHPCERCACEAQCSSPKKCAKWRRWFKKRWQECVESIRSSAAAQDCPPDGPQRASGGRMESGADRASGGVTPGR